MSDRPGICLCLAADTLEANLRHVAAYRDRIDLVELRVDLLRADERAAAARFPRLVDLPAILTVRRPRDGGRFDDDEADRAALLERLAGGGFAWVDLEEDFAAPRVEERAREAGARVVRSLHDFDGVPADLGARLAALRRGPGDMAKTAVMPRSCADLARVIAAAAADPGPHVVLGMGEVGFPTRVLAARLGSAWTYASPGTDTVAPGQADPMTLTDVYRFAALRAETPVYGVLGNPVVHSRSPLIHNAGYAALGIDAVYLPFAAPDLDGAWEVADALAARGLSVTVPHKEAVMERLGVADALAAAAGACNTMLRPSGTGPWQGTNTDVAGFLSPLRELLGPDGLRGISATVIGAGGAARAVVHGLVGAGARVLVMNRTRGRAKELAAAMGAAHAGTDAAGVRAARGYADLVVQATSAGMAGDSSDPVPGLKLGGREIVYELVYSLPETPFLARARSAGCRVIEGRKMLLAQALMQFQLFTGREYPPGLATDMLARID